MGAALEGDWRGRAQPDMRRSSSRQARRWPPRAQTPGAQVETLRRIPEKMDPALYYKTFRPLHPLFRGGRLRRHRLVAPELPRRDRLPRASVSPGRRRLSSKFPTKPSMLTGLTSRTCAGSCRPTIEPPLLERDRAASRPPWQGRQAASTTTALRSPGRVSRNPPRIRRAVTFTPMRATCQARHGWNSLPRMAQPVDRRDSGPT